MYTSEADFHKPGMYGGGERAWAAAWDVFRRAPPRGGRDRRAAVDFVECFGWDGSFRVFCSRFFFQAEDGIRDQPRSRGLGDVYKRQHVELNVKHHRTTPRPEIHITAEKTEAALARK